MNFGLLQGELQFIDGEFGLIEIFQLSFLILGLTITFRKRKLLIKNANKLSFFIRISIFTFLIYEESSFLTKYLFAFSSKFNTHSEINLHNSIIWSSVAIKIPFTQFDVLISTIFALTSVILISFGSYINSLKKFNLCFLQRKYSYIGLFLVMSRLIREYTSLEGPIIHTEIMELLIYLTLFLDSKNRSNKITY